MQLSVPNTINTIRSLIFIKDNVIKQIIKDKMIKMDRLVISKPIHSMWAHVLEGFVVNLNYFTPISMHVFLLGEWQHILYLDSTMITELNNLEYKFPHMDQLCQSMDRQSCTHRYRSMVLAQLETPGLLQGCKTLSDSQDSMSTAMYLY